MTKKRDMTKVTGEDLVADLETMSRLLAPDQRDDYTAINMIFIIVAGVLELSEKITSCTEDTHVDELDRLKALAILRPWMDLAAQALIAKSGSSAPSASAVPDSDATFAAKAGSREDN